MDIHNIFDSYEKCKKIVDQLKLHDIKHAKKLLTTINNSDYKKVIEAQYLFMFQKQCNINHTKSVNIIELEDRLKDFESKSILEIIKDINKLGYNDKLLTLLNLNINKVSEIKKNINLENKIYGGLNIENIVNKTVGKIMEQIVNTKNSDLDTTTEESILSELTENKKENIINTFIGGKIEEMKDTEDTNDNEENEENEENDENIYSKFIKDKENENNTLYTVEIKKNGITEERILTKKDEDLLKQIESDDTNYESDDTDYESDDTDNESNNINYYDDESNSDF